MSSAIDRVRSRLEVCPHPKGTNGTKRKITVGAQEVIATVDPNVTVRAGDIVELAASIPEGQRTQVARDLLKGASACPADAEVHIKVDDCHHLVEAAQGSAHAT